MKKLIPVIIALSFFSKSFADSFQDMKNIVQSFYSFQKSIDNNMYSVILNYEDLDIIYNSLTTNIPVMKQGVEKAKQEGFKDIENLLSIYIAIGELQLIQINALTNKSSEMTLKEYLMCRKKVIVLINIVKPMY